MVKKEVIHKDPPHQTKKIATKTPKDLILKFRGEITLVLPFEAVHAYVYFEKKSYILLFFP